LQVKLSTHCRIYPVEGDPGSKLLFSTKKAATVALPVEMISDIEDNNITQEESESLIDLGIVVTHETDEKKEMLSYINMLNSIDSVLKVIVVMNMDCNLACTYCFEGTRKGKYFMSKATANDLIHYIGDRLHPDLGELRVVFYGGEPLLSKTMIADISRMLGVLAQDREIKFGFSLVTNGTLLTPKVVEELKPLGLRGAKITIDGPKDNHDVFRPYKKGVASSFDTIVNNIREISTMIGIQLGGNFTQANYSRFPGLLEYLQQVGLGPDRVPAVKFDPVTQEDLNYGPQDFRDGCRSINEPWLVSASIFLRDEILRRGYKTQKIKPSPCIIDLDNTVVVNYDGSLYKCPGLIGREDFCVGSLSTGVRDYKKTHNLDNWKNDECLCCAYLPLCFGGCRYMNLISKGNMEGIDCRKTYFDATLERFVLQDIAYENK